MRGWLGRFSPLSLAEDTQRGTEAYRVRELLGMVIFSSPRTHTLYLRFMLQLPYAAALHFVFETLGVLLGMRLYYRLGRGQVDPLPQDRRFAIFIAAGFGALLGSRLLGALEDPALFWSGGGPLGFSYYLTSKTIVGGLLGGLWTVELTKRALGERTRSGDRFVFPLLLAMAIGRIGCLLMGTHEPTYGLPTILPWGLDLGDGLRRHPTAAYEIVFLSLLALALYRLQRRQLPNGWLFLLFLPAYLVYRFAVGFIQPGVRPTGGWTVIQWACAVGLLYYAVEWIREVGRKGGKVSSD